MKYEHIYGQERKQMRWFDFDYESQGVYFVTVVTYRRACLFGKVVNGEMILNEAGSMILAQYNEMECCTVQCMDVVVMPNHIHFMVYIPHDGASSLPVIMKDFKSTTTMLYCRGVKDKGWQPFYRHLWQRSYWDDIVWNGRMFEFIRRYIYLNPQRWDKDAINDDHGADLDDINACLKKLK